MIIIIDRANLL